MMRQHKNTKKMQLIFGLSFGFVCLQFEKLCAVLMFSQHFSISLFSFVFFCFLKVFQTHKKIKKIKNVQKTLNKHKKTKFYNLYFWFVFKFEHLLFEKMLFSLFCYVFSIFLNFFDCCFGICNNCFLFVVSLFF